MLAMLEFAVPMLELAVVAVAVLELAVAAKAVTSMAIASKDPMPTVSAMPMRKLVCSICSCSCGGAPS